MWWGRKRPWLCWALWLLHTCRLPKRLGSLADELGGAPQPRARYPHRGVSSQPRSQPPVSPTEGLRPPPGITIGPVSHHKGCRFTWPPLISLKPQPDVEVERRPWVLSQWRCSVVQTRMCGQSEPGPALGLGRTLSPVRKCGLPPPCGLQKTGVQGRGMEMGDPLHWQASGLGGG